MLNSAWLLLFYLCEVQLCKIEALQYISGNNIPDNLLEKFSSSEKNFRLSGNNEIEMNGRMFDIVKKEISNGSIVYYAISDNKEDKIIQNIFGLQKADGSLSTLPSSGKKNVEEVLKYTTQKDCWNTNLQLKEICILSYSKQNVTIYSSPVLEILSPPPRLLFI